MPQLRVQQPMRGTSDTNSLDLNQHIASLNLETNPAKTSGSRTPTTKLNEKSKAFRPRFLQNKNTGGK